MAIDTLDGEYKLKELRLVLDLINDELQLKMYRDSTSDFKARAALTKLIDLLSYTRAVMI